MRTPGFDPAFTPLQQAEVLARAAWSLMHDARRRTHLAEHRDEWAQGLAMGYSFALCSLLGMRRQLRRPRIVRDTSIYTADGWEIRADGTMIRREPERFTPAWIEQHRPRHEDTPAERDYREGFGVAIDRRMLEDGRSTSYYRGHDDGVTARDQAQA